MKSLWQLNAVGQTLVREFRQTQPLATEAKIIDCGGTAMLAETTELIGAEHLLADRSRNEHVPTRVAEVIKRMEQSVLDMGVDFKGANTAPGNIRARKK